MHTGRRPLSLGDHGKISTTRGGDGRFQPGARLRTWHGELHRVTAAGTTAAAARALLTQRTTERLRTSERFVWRTMTPDDPFHELVICWLEGLLHG